MRPARKRRAPKAWSLATRIIALVVSATTIVAIIGAALTLQLLRTTIRDETRTELTDQLSLVANSEDPIAAREWMIGWAEQTDAMWAIVAADGTVTGTASDDVSEELVGRLRAEGSVSDIQLRPTRPLILEGQMIAGDGVVLARTDYVLAIASRELILRVLPVLGLGVVGAVLGAAFLARRITSPLVQTAAAADRLASGDRGLEVPASEIPEVGSVARALTSLDEALITSEGRQREFLLSISHDLRTPLTAIRGYGEALADGVIDGPTGGPVIEKEAARLSRFVDDLLELARLEADDFTIELSAVDLSDVAAAAHSAWQGHAKRLGVQLGLEVVGTADVIETDGRRARQLVDGLIENALRMTPEGGSVRIVVAPQWISVVDDGPGLDPEDLPRVFDRGIVRARYAEARPVGTGLGLSIAARLAPRLGAHISVSTEESGTTFSVIWEGDSPSERS